MGDTTDIFPGSGGGLIPRPSLARVVIARHCRHKLACRFFGIVVASPVIGLVWHEVSGHVTLPLAALWHVGELWRGWW